MTTSAQQDMNKLDGHSDNEPCVFVTTYSLYNEGIQFKNAFTGFWITCEAYEANSDIIEASFDEQDPDQAGDHEYMFTDFENFPDSLYSESGMNFETIATWYDMDDDDKAKVDAYTSLISNDLAEAMEKIEDMYMFDGTEADYAQETTEDCSEIPDFLQGYIDWEAMGRDMACDGNMHKVDANTLLITLLITR